MHDPTKAKLQGAISLIQARRYSDARGLLLDLLAREPQNVRATLLLSEALSQLGDHAAAVETAKLAVSLAPESADAHWQLGTVLLRGNQPREAESFLDRALALKPDHAPIYVTSAKALAAQHRLQPALDRLQSALRLDPAIAEAWSMKAMLLPSMGRKDEAAGAAREALRLAPASPRAHLAEGIVALTRLDAAKAVASYREVLRNDPTNASARSGYVAAARLALPFLGPLLSKRKGVACAIIVLYAVASVLLTYAFGNILVGVVLGVLTIAVLFRAVHMTGTLLIYNDAPIRHALSRTAIVTAGWFFADLAVVATSAIFSAVFKNGGMGWIAITCALGAVATTMYGSAAELPKTARPPFHLFPWFAVLGLYLTGFVQTVSLSLGILMALAGGPGYEALQRAHYEFPFLVERVVLPLLALTGTFSIMAFFGYLTFLGGVRIGRVLHRRMTKRAAHA